MRRKLTTVGLGVLNRHCQKERKLSLQVKTFLKTHRWWCISTIVPIKGLWLKFSLKLQAFIVSIVNSLKSLSNQKTTSNEHWKYPWSLFSNISNTIESCESNGNGNNNHNKLLNWHPMFWNRLGKSVQSSESIFPPYSNNKKQGAGQRFHFSSTH